MDKNSVLNQVEKIISHDLFRSSRRSVSFLKYVCSKKLEGNTDHIKEYSIAVDAFGLAADFDQQQNPRIRVEAKRLRDRLEQYYISDGSHDPVVISLPRGSYIPEFQLNSEYNENQSREEDPLGQMNFSYYFGDVLLRLQFQRLQSTIYDSYDYIYSELLQYLFIRSGNREKRESEHKLRIHGLIKITDYSGERYYHITLQDPLTGRELGEARFNCAGKNHPDILTEKKTIYEMAEFLITECKNPFEKKE